MARTFAPYTPKYITLTPEQLAKIPEGATLRFGLHPVKQKNGDTYVNERAYYLDENHNPKDIVHVKFGKIPKAQPR